MFNVRIQGGAKSKQRGGRNFLGHPVYAFAYVARLRERERYREGGDALSVLEEEEDGSENNTYTPHAKR